MADGQWPLLLDRRVCDLGGVWTHSKIWKSGTLRISLSSLPPFRGRLAFELLALIVAHGNGTGLAGQISGWGKTPDCWNGRVANVDSSKNRNSFQELQPDWISRRLIEYRLLFFFWKHVISIHLF